MPKKYSTIIRYITTAFIFSLVSLIICLYIFLIPASNISHVINIPQSASVTKISSILKSNSLIHSEFFFKLALKISNKDTLLRAGHFYIPTQTNQQQLIRILTTSNGAYNLEKVVIPEGFSISQIAQTLEKKEICNKDEFEEYAHNLAKDKFSNEFKFLSSIPSSITTIEGYLFPNTYFFKKNESIPTIIRSMLKEFNKKIAIPYNQSLKVQTFKYNFHQLVTLASMIEKETRVVDEMPRISSVFYNRLRKRMRLSSDPTVVYALGKSYKDRVYYKDLKVKSPYNTYRVGGFPPSAIASPGQKAFKAACFPESTTFLFFVASNDGRHYFSNSYQEHLAFQRKNKRKN